MANSVVPVIEVGSNNEEVEVMAANSRTTSGVSAVYTTPDDQDFYLTGWVFGYSADAACDGEIYELEITFEGAAKDVVQVRKLPLNGQYETFAKDLTCPIKLDRGTEIKIRQTFTLGNSYIYCNVTGYLK